MENTLTLMRVRKVTVFDSATQFLKVYETASDKWSELAELIRADGLDLSNRDAVLGSTQGHLVLPDALIPPEDQTIFTVQKKMNSGAVSKEGSNFKDMDYYSLLRACKAKNIATGSSPSKKSLLELLTKGTGIKETKSIKTKKEIVAKVKKVAADTTPSLEERIKYLENAVGQMYVGLKGLSNNLSFKIETSKTVETLKSTPTPSIEELNKQADLIKKSLRG